MAPRRGAPTRQGPAHTQAAAQVDRGTDHKGSPVERQQLALWSGPLPPPETLNGYNQVRAGLADEIIREFQAEGTHRRGLERDQASLVKLEVIFGFAASLVSSLVLMAVAAYAVHEQQQWVGGIIGAGGIVNGIAAFRKVASTEPADPQPPKRQRKKS